MKNYAPKKDKQQTLIQSPTIQPKAEKQQVTLNDNRSETVMQQRLVNTVNNSDRVTQLQQYQEMADNSQTAKANQTGLPLQLKSGIENLSGYAMDDVKVHYNSDKPAQLKAHAYAQGTDIHLASGQEKHLPHEAWHVVQQKQGRVKPTLQMKGKVNVNDNKGLEREADVMGSKALQNPTSKNKTLTTTASVINEAPIQGVWGFGWLSKLLGLDETIETTPESVEEISKIEPQIIEDTPIGESKGSQDVPMDKLKVIEDLPMAKSKSVEDVPMDKSKIIADIPIEKPKTVQDIPMVAPKIPEVSGKTIGIMRQVQAKMQVLEERTLSAKNKYLTLFKGFIISNEDWERNQLRSTSVEIITNLIMAQESSDEFAKKELTKAKDGEDRDEALLGIISTAIALVQKWEKDQIKLEKNLIKLKPKEEAAKKIGLTWEDDSETIMNYYAQIGGIAPSGQVGTVCTKTDKAGGHYTYKGTILDMFHSSHGNANSNSNDSRTAFTIVNPVTKVLEVVGIGVHNGPNTYDVIFFNSTNTSPIIGCSAQPEITHA